MKSSCRETDNCFSVLKDWTLLHDFYQFKVNNHR